MGVVSDPSVLSGNAAAYLQDYLSYRKSFAHHLIQIYSPHDLLCGEKKCTPNKSTSSAFEEKKGPDPNGITE